MNLDSIFSLTVRGTNWKREVMAGITTFLTMAYILIVNPTILGEAGMDSGAVFTATAIASAAATLVMAFLANLPIALAPGMGLNAFFAYTVVISMGFSWQMALAAVFIEGIVFIVLSLLNVREAIVNSIPMNLKRAISIGIGFFITFIGLQNAGIIAAYDSTMVTLGDITSTSAILALIGLMAIGVLLYYRVRGSILIGIALVTLIGTFTGTVSMPDMGWTPPSLEPTFAEFDFSQLLSMDMLIVVFTFLFVDIFDTAGTLIGLSTKSGMITSDGKVPKAKQSFFADSVGTTIGALLGTSTTTCYIESASGIAEGGKTGLTSVVVSLLFLFSLFLAPVFLAVPEAATASALIVVGVFMITPIREIDFDDYTEAIPAFLTIIMMPLAYSISDGIVFGLLAFVFLKVLTGQYKQISKTAYVLAVVFLIWLFVI